MSVPSKHQNLGVSGYWSIGVLLNHLRITPSRQYSHYMGLRASMKGIIFVSFMDPAPRPFDLAEDPKCFQNLAREKPEVVKAMYEKVAESGGGPLPVFDYLPSHMAGATFSTAMTRKMKKDGAS